MRNQRRILSALMFAAIMSTTLSADIGSIGGANAGSCLFIEGLGFRIPVKIAEMLWVLFGC